MKYVVAILLTALLAFALGLYLPWWSVAIAGFLVSIIIRQKPFMSWISGFIGIFLLWEVLAWRIDSSNNSLLSSKIAQILPLGGSVMLLIFISAIVGSLVGGFAALAGAYTIGKKREEILDEPIAEQTLVDEQ